MDVDNDWMADNMTSSTSHPLSILHREFLGHLSNILPHLAYDAAMEEQARRAHQANGKLPGKGTAPKSSLFASIHAPKSGSPEYVRAFVMPSPEDVQGWSVLDCIYFVLEFPPGEDVNRARSRRRPEIGKLKLFLLSHDKPGGRKGKDWSMGDWKVGLDELEDVAEYCNWVSVKESVDICRRRLGELCPA